MFLIVPAAFKLFAQSLALANTDWAVAAISPAVLSLQDEADASDDKTAIDRVTN